jgi:hypothetical protein
MAYTIPPVTTLNMMCTSAARFAWTEAPIAAMTAVEVLPILCPMTSARPGERDGRGMERGERGDERGA